MADFTLTSFSSTAQTLTGLETGVLTNSDAELVVASGDAITVNNSGSAGTNYLYVNGSVIAANNSAFARTIYHDGTRLEVTVGATGRLFSFTGQALLSNPSDTFRLYNSGEISSNGLDALDIRTSDPGARIVIVNSGLIQGRNSAVATVSGTEFTRIINTGTIIASETTAIFANWSGAGNGMSVLNNTGTIIGARYSFSSSSADGVHVVRNSGTMDGDIFLGENDDRYDGAGGLMVGTVLGGDDDDQMAGGDFHDHFAGESGLDTLVGRGGDDLLEGGGGGDLLLGGDGNDEMDGGGDDDTMNGNSGNDTMTGGEGNDILVGQDGADLLDGGTENDTLDGGAGNDTLEGGSGNDILRGRAGEDDLAGGLGLDLLTGGQDADNFVFRSLAETVVGANRDQILDFEQGLDTIVVAGLSPGVFEFRGTSPFAPSGNPELRLFETPTGSTIVQLDANGDGTQDAEIRVANVTGLTAEDFAL